MRALIWHRMGENAASLPTDAEVRGMPAFLRNHPDRPNMLSPSAEQCFRHGLELCPNQLDNYEALFRYYERSEKNAKASRPLPTF